MTRYKEFVALMAISMSLVALAIDAMLPALGRIGDDLGLVHDNDRQLVLTVLFIGLAVGQLFYGPVSDTFGRRKPIFFGYGLFLVGSLITIAAPSFDWLLAGRFLQGLGAAAPRIITVAIIRDRAAGRDMARIMSLVMMVFILVPAVAPALGQVILLFTSWRGIFVALLLLAGATMAWFYLRQPETLPPDRRRPFSPAALGGAFREVLTTRSAVVYTLAGGMIFGAFVGFLNSSQQLLQELYELGSRFPAYFAVLALTIGASSFVNARLVARLGMRYLCRVALIVSVLASMLFGIYCLFRQPDLFGFMVYLMITFFSTGILFGNLNALAMEPLGHIAGMASSLVGSVTTFISLGLGFLIGNAFNGTVLPVVAGFAILGALSLAAIWLFGD
jgi:DHA1 family bicyclomycin/chloramphenicol resistance-like MFS transporter